MDQDVAGGAIYYVRERVGRAERSELIWLAQPSPSRWIVDSWYQRPGLALEYFRARIDHDDQFEFEPARMIKAPRQRDSMEWPCCKHRAQPQE